MNKKMIDFMVATYALPKVLLTLYDCKVRDFAITQEDGDLHIRLSYNELESIVYYKNNSNDVSCNLCEIKETSNEI